MKIALPSLKCLIPLILFSHASYLYGVNHVVQLGQSIQDKVALADTGDVVIIRGGTHSEQDINGSKAIRLVREKDTTVTIGGSITFTGVDGQMVLRDFPIDLNGNGKLTLSNCSQFGLEDLTKLPQGVDINGSTVIIRDCVFTGNLKIEGNSSVEMINSTCVNLDVSGSKLHAVDSVFAAVTTTGDSNITLVDSNFTTGSFTSGLVFLKDSVASAAVSFNASTWRSHGSTFKDNFTSTNSHTNLFRSTVEKAFSHVGSSKDCVIYQSTLGRVSGHELFSDANRTWVTYSDVHHISHGGGTEAYFIKNRFLTDKNKNFPSISANGPNCKYFINNNYFWKNGSSGTHAQVGPIPNTTWTLIRTIWVGKKVEKVTNRIHSSGDYYDWTKCVVKYYYADNTKRDVEKSHGERSGSTWSGTLTYNNPIPDKAVSKIEIHLYSQDRGYEKDTLVYLSEGGSSSRTVLGDLLVGVSKEISILNNLFRRPDEYAHCISIDDAPTNGAIVQGNAFWRDSGTWRNFAVSGPEGGTCINNYFQSSNAAHQVTGGIAHFDNITGTEPGFVNVAGMDFSLTSDSILKDAGSAEFRFDDHDGTRNDIGMLGGHAYDINGTNADIPVVLSTTQSVYKINTGDTAPLIIQARGAVSTQ